jgi:LPXTG-site transpeptidase (sortase) family protein
MQSKISFTLSPFIAGIAGIAFSSMIIFFLTFDLSGQASYTIPASPSVNQSPQNLNDGKSVEYIQSIAFPVQPRPGLPIRLKIPKINVDAAIEPVGVAPDGAMDTPQSPDDVAWFELGPRPGENGSAVIAGHYGWENGKTLVFINVYTLQKGDKIYVEDTEGEVITFVVRESRSYDPNADTSGVFVSNDGKAHLNLITCEGVWDKHAEQYTKRLIVFTDKETK